MSADDPQRVVAVWRRVLLPVSETFIRNQVAAMHRWQPALLGLHGIDPTLPVPGALLLDADQRWNRVKRGASGRVGWAFGLRPALRAVRADLVHAHFLTDALGIWSSVRATRLPFAVTAHGYDVTESAPGLRADHPRAWAAFVDSVDVFLPVSTFLADRLADLGVRDQQILTHYTGVPVPERSGPPDGERTGIVFVGRLVEKKGCADLLEAVHRLGEPLRSTPVTVVGDGPLRASLERLAGELGVRVQFTGSQPFPVVQTLMRQARVFCVPSKTSRDGDAEGFGMVFLEASAARLPVVTYRSGGTPESVEDDVSGLLVAEGDVGALSGALARVLTDAALCHRLGDGGRLRLERDFDIQDLTGRLEDTYDAMLARRVR